MSEFRSLQELFSASDKGWKPPALPPAEELRRVRLLIGGCANRILAGKITPGLVAAFEKLVAREEQLTKGTA